MSRIMLSDMLRFIWISGSPNFCLELMMKAYVMKQQLASVFICFAYVCFLTFLWEYYLKFMSHLRCFNWSKIHRAAAHGKTAFLIVQAYGTLLMVDARYISLAIVLIILLAFIGALFVRVSLIDPLKRDEDDHKSGNKADDGTAASTGDMDNRLWLKVTAILPCCVLSCIRHFNSGDLAIYHFLLFLSSALGELSLLMASLPSDLAPAYEVIHRAYLVVVLVTAHTMAAELLGDTAVLVCTPELVAALAWLTIQLGHGGYTTVRTLEVEGQDELSRSSEIDHSSEDIAETRETMTYLQVREQPILPPNIEAVLRKADIPVLGVVAILTYLLAAIADESEVVTDLLSSYMSALIACAFSVMLPFLCVIALRQWRVRTPAAPSSELEGAIRLLSFCRDILLKAEVMFLVVKPLVDVRLRLQLYGFAAERWNVVIKNFGGPFAAVSWSVL